MLIRKTFLLILACSQAWAAAADLPSGSLARSDEEFASVDGGPAGLLRGSAEPRGVPLDRGRRQRHARSVAGRAVFPAVLAGFVLVFGFFWDAGEGDLSGKAAQRMELWAPPAVCAAGQTSPNKCSGKGIESSDICVLPVLSSDFVRTCSSTQLAVACVPFGEPDGWSTDVLGFMGVPVLSAAAGPDRNGGRMLEIRRRGSGRDDPPLVAVRAGQVFSAGTSLGRFTSSGTGRHVFQDSHGRPLLVAAQSSSDRALTMSSDSEGKQVQATAAWRAASAVLPAEHLEVSAQPGVDAALALACVLATLDASSGGDICRRRELAF